MKKKFIAVYALIGVLALGSTTLTSCVDDNESASVTAIRDAKAAQLTALANYQDVKAQNEKILAEADAAIKEAEAEAKRIANELQNIELQKAQATLSADLETLKAKAEAALLQQQAVLENAKKELIYASNSVDAAVQEKITKLLESANAIMYGGNLWEYYTTTNSTDNGDGTTTTNSSGHWGYTTIAEDNSITGMQTQLIELKSDLIEAQYDLKDGQRLLAQELNTQRADSAYYEAMLKAYNDNKITDKEDAEQAAKEAYAAYIPLNDVTQAALAAKNNAETKVDDAETKVAATEIGQFMATSMTKDFDEDGDGTSDKTYNLEDYIEDVTPEVEDVIYTFDDGTAEVRYAVAYSTQKYALDTEEMATAITEVDRRIEAAEAKVEAKKKERDDKLKADNSEYKQKKDAVETAQKNYEKDPEDPTVYGSTGYLLAQAEQELKNYEDEANSEVEKAEAKVVVLEDEKKYLTDFQTMMTATSESYKAYETVYAEYVAAEAAYVDADIAYLKAYYNSSTQYQLYTTLQGYAGGLTDWESQINTAATNLNNAKENIEKLVAGIYDNGSGSEESLAYLVDAKKQEIENQEAKIAQMEAKYDAYMAEVEALINGETGLPEIPDTPSTDTPAEGEGEETPAE